MTGKDASTAGSPATVNHVALAAGSRIGRYEVLSVLGQGGFGITYRARDTQLSREVAIKEYLPTALAVRHDSSTVLPRATDVADDFVWGRDRFIAEGRTLASLHEAPAIVRVFDFLEANGTAYIVMELLRGETLEARVKRRGQLPFGELDAILWPLLDGLEHVHQAGFLHRDIKPANILLNAGGRPTLIDFGASRAAIAGRSATMTAVFTPGFAAAEQFTSAKQGPWTDVYGLAASFYCAVTGSPPPSAFDRMLDDGYAPLAGRSLPQFPRALLAGIDAGLAVRAADRPQSVAAWRSLLQGVAAGDEATVVANRPAAAQRAAATPTPPRKRRAALVAGGAVIAAILLMAGGYFTLMPKPGPASVSLQDMKVEELEKALDARRKADAEAAERRRIEEEAQRKAAADADAKRAADAELAAAQAERQKAEAELARLKAELEAQKKAAEDREHADAAARQAAIEEAQRQAEAEAKTRREAEEEASRKAAAEAETKRQADEALAKAQAERQRADEAAARTAEVEAKQKAEADARTKAEAEARVQAEAKTEADAKKAAEAAETGLRFSPLDRQRLQVALTSLGFDTRGSDGTFGPRSRQMIAAWQKARNLPPSGFLDASQQQTLLREGAVAVGRYDEEQKKIEDDKRKAEDAKRKAEEEAKAKPPAPAPAAAPAAPAPSQATSASSGLDGSYHGSLVFSVSVGAGASSTLTGRVTVSGGQLSGTLVDRRCGEYGVTATVSQAGDIKGSVRFMEDPQCSAVPSTVSGRISGNQLQLYLRNTKGQASGTLTKGGG